MKEIPVFSALLLAIATVSLLSSCTPRVEVAVPDKPIEININAKIDHQVKIQVEKEVDNLFEGNSKLF